MAFALLNGNPVISGRITLPRLGCWHADIVVDADADITGGVVLGIDGGLSLYGYVRRGGQWQGTTYLRVVGGAGGLQRLCKPKHYSKTVTGRVVASDVLTGAGEKLSATAQAGVLDRAHMAGWTTIAQPAGNTLNALVANPAMPSGAVWRVLPDGSVWFGVDSWPAVSLQIVTDYQEVDRNPMVGSTVLGVEAPWLTPGVALDARRVSVVEHVIDGETARTMAWVE